ncbi:hypothetical protein KUCAC02_035403 [Chaenocephalus aceratus]|nr:hypothetical protein KUCAC02_035403 [Chaenocephalus aceratus]
MAGASGRCGWSEWPVWLERVAGVAGASGRCGWSEWPVWLERVAGMAGASGRYGWSEWPVWLERVAGMAGASGRCGWSEWPVWLERVAGVAGASGRCGWSVAQRLKSMESDSIVSCFIYPSLGWTALSATAPSGWSRSRPAWRFTFCVSRASFSTRAVFRLAGNRLNMRAFQGNGK